MADIHHTETPRTTVTHVETRRGAGGSALWLVLGAVLALLLAWFLIGGTDGGDTVRIETAPAGAVEGAADAVEGAAAAVEGAATVVEGAAAE